MVIEALSSMSNAELRDFATMCRAPIAWAEQRDFDLFWYACEMLEPRRSELVEALRAIAATAPHLADIIKALTPPPPSTTSASLDTVKQD